MTAKNRCPYLDGKAQHTIMKIDGLTKMCKFDGVDDYAYKTVADFRSGDSLGAIWVRFKANNITSTGFFFASCDNGTDYYYLVFGINASLHALTVIQRNGADIGTRDLIYGNTVVDDNVWHNAILVSTGTEYKMYVDGNDEGALIVSAGSNTGDWFADTINRDNITIGSQKRSSIDGYFAGLIAQVIVTNTVPSAGEIAAFTPNPTDVVGKWLMNDGQSLTLTDSSGGGNNMTVSLGASSEASFHSLVKI